MLKNSFSKLKIMKKLILLLALTIGLTMISRSQNVYIPDANFKEYLLGNQRINTNGDSEIQISEAESETANLIVVYEKEISDLTGIEAFINLTFLSCSYNQLTELDITNNVNLTWLQCAHNQISTLDLSNNVNLTNLECDNNLLTGLDVSNNISITNLECYYNFLTTLDLSNNINLATLECYNNQLTILNISNNENLTLLKCDDNELTTLDGSDCISLTRIECNNNLLNTLDLTNNINLATLECFNNTISTLNLINNENLSSLHCSSNELISIDVSNNLNLSSFSCSSNLLSALDVSNNANLRYLYCNDNQLSTLSVSNNLSLKLLRCYNNNLTELSLRNGNNSILNDVKAYNNPNLSCIEVDDVELALNQANWEIDEGSVYQTNCNLTNHIYGSFLMNNECITNGNQAPFSGVIIKTEPDYHFAITDVTGEFVIHCDTGKVYTIEPAMSHPLITPFCPTPFQHEVYFDQPLQDTSGITFYGEAIECPLLSVDISSTSRRRCFTAYTFVEYKNDGYADEPNAQILVDFPEFVNLISADYPYTINNEGTYVFEIGLLQAQTQGAIHIVDSVSCIENITGLSQCTKARITPKNDCLYDLDTDITDWDRSSIYIPGGECVGDSIVQIYIINHGDDMLSASEYRIYSNNLLVYTNQFQLVANDTLTVAVSANGTNIRVEADQHIFHPGNSHPNTTVKGCGNSGDPIVFDSGTEMPADDEDYEVEIDCLPIIDSYDPNDKQVIPAGIGENRIVHPSAMLEYMIRFQNTGSDTAFQVIVVDTLSEYIDVSSIQWGLSSHPYSLNVSGQNNPVLTFTFENINLLDSTSDESQSHGFLKFKAKPSPGTANGTIINNLAYIYFDYNLPILTNNAWITISDVILEGDPIIPLSLNSIKEEQSQLTVYPNPVINNLEILLPKNCETTDLNVFVYNLTGTQIQVPYKTKSNSIQLNMQKLSQGMYIIELSSKGDFMYRSKIMKR